MKFAKTIALASVTLFILINASCTPEEERTTSCSAEIYGYSGGRYIDDTTTTFSTSFGRINTSTGAISSIATGRGMMSNRQGAFNSSDNAYYYFAHVDSTDTLYRIDMSGAVTPLAYASTDNYFSGLVYDGFHNKLYCFRRNGTSNFISEITVSGATYTTSDLTTISDPQYDDNATVDNNTGTLYYETYSSTAAYQIEKYAPGGAAPSTIATGLHEYWGLRFNTSDNSIYAIQPGGAIGNYSLFKISTTGVSSFVADLGFDVNPKYYSACIDNCDNKYYLSFKEPTTLTTAGHLYQIDMTGSIVSHHSLPTPYSCMAVKY